MYGTLTKNNYNNFSPDIKKFVSLHNIFLSRIHNLYSTPSKVPVGLWTSTSLPPLISDGTSQEQTSTTAMADPTAMPGHGCNIEGKFYMDGMQVCII